MYLISEPSPLSPMALLTADSVSMLITTTTTTKEIS
jgi:hypothetical protein